MNKKNNIDQLFANKLHGAGVEPSKAAWEQLEANLAQNQQKKGVLWMRVAAAVVILLAATLSWKFFSAEDYPQHQFAKAPAEFLKAPFPKPMPLQEINLSGVMAIYDAYEAGNKKNEKNIFSVQPSNKSQHLPNVSNQKTIELVALQKPKNDQSKETDPVLKNTEELKTPVIAPIETAVALQDETKVDTVDPVAIESLEGTFKTDQTVAVLSEELPKVTITYVGQEEKAKEKSKFSIKKVFKSAKKLANGDLIAEF
ncbi:MAG: hypothetical protein AAFQ94_31015 [Bacteroidota bacterium]